MSHQVEESLSENEHTLYLLLDHYYVTNSEQVLSCVINSATEGNAQVCSLDIYLDKIYYYYYYTLRRAMLRYVYIPLDTRYARY